MIQPTAIPHKPAHKPETIKANEPAPTCPIHLNYKTGHRAPQSTNRQPTQQKPTLKQQQEEQRQQQQQESRTPTGSAD